MSFIFFFISDICSIRQTYFTVVALAVYCSEMLTFMVDFFYC